MIVVNTTWFMTHALTGGGCMSYCCEHMFMMNITHYLMHTLDCAQPN